MNILIVEDDPDSRLMMQSLLESAQHEVTSVPNGQRALISMRKQQPDLIISDIMMPEMDGFELCYTVKHDNQLRHIPFIFCTATYVDSADERLALQLGAERFMLKPIEPQDFLNVVTEFTPQNRSSRSSSRKVVQSTLKHADFLHQHHPRINHKLDKKIRELEMLRRLIDISNDAFFVIREDDGSFEYVNGRACERLGYTRDELMNLSVLDIVVDFPTMEEWYRHVETMRLSPAAVFESAHIRKDGSYLPVEVSVMHDQSGGKTPLISAVARDITERQLAKKRQEKLEAQLSQARTMEALGTLAGGIAHDFNNIIGAINGYTEMAQRNLNSPDKLQNCLSQVMNASQRARDLVAQVLAFSRRGNHTLEAIDLKDIICEVIDLLRPSLAQRTKIETDIDPACSKVVADPGQMHQVIMNLCSNALQAMEEQDRGTILITLRNSHLDPGNAAEYINLEAGDYVELQVQDNGSGMEEETKRRIFEPYFSTRKKRGGNGLGLAVVHGIIEDFKGSISVESLPGQKTVFTVLLPAAAIGKDTDHHTQAMQQNHPPIQIENSPSSKHLSKHLLVVDDEEHIVSLIKNMLERHGYEVTCTTSSQHALEVFKGRKDAFDMVITDYAMPEMTGIELAQSVRNIRPDIPVLMCSGYYAGKEQRGASDAGIEMVLNKPLQDYQLTLAVDNILNT
ncbi:MAG: response regulator [Desulfuromonadaceae bacterium]